MCLCSVQIFLTLRLCNDVVMGVGQESGTPNGDAVRSRAEPGALAAGGLADPNSALVERLQRELRTVAALEVGFADPMY